MADTADHLDELLTRYPQIQDAAQAALEDALKASPDSHEWGGAIFQRGKEFYATRPQSSGGAFDIGVTATAERAGDKLVAIYHTHPNGRDAQLFSPHDVQVARSLRVPSFIGLVKDGSARVFDPSVDRPEPIDPRRRYDPRAGAAYGRNALRSVVLNHNSLSDYASRYGR